MNLLVTAFPSTWGKDIELALVELTSVVAKFWSISFLFLSFFLSYQGTLLKFIYLFIYLIKFIKLKNNFLFHWSSFSINDKRTNKKSGREKNKVKIRKRELQIFEEREINNTLLNLWSNLKVFIKWIGWLNNEVKKRKRKEIKQLKLFIEKKKKNNGFFVIFSLWKFIQKGKKKKFGKLKRFYLRQFLRNLFKSWSFIRILFPT